MKVALVIGGTGMLSEVTLQLAQQFDIVGVVGRSKSKMDSISKITNIIPIFTDYADGKAFQSTLESFLKKYEKAVLVVSWIHATSPSATMIAAQCCKGDFYEVTGSPDSDNHALSYKHEPKIKELGINYHRITLGSIDGRWLTNDEISKGVLEAIKKNEEQFIVGNV